MSFAIICLRTLFAGYVYPWIVINHLMIMILSSVIATPLSSLYPASFHFFFLSVVLLNFMSSQLGLHNKHPSVLHFIFILAVSALLVFINDTTMLIKTLEFEI